MIPPSEMSPINRRWRGCVFASIPSAYPEFVSRGLAIVSQTTLGSSTSCWLSQETGAMFVYQGQSVSLLWQSKQAATASARVSGESQAGSAITGGFEWSRPYGIS